MTANNDRKAVDDYISSVPAETRRRDAETLLELMRRASGKEPYMWSNSIIGFGRYEYRYESGRSGDGPAASFSPRKAATTIYLPDGVAAHADALRCLGPHTTGVGCVYIKNLSQVDLSVLEGIVRKSYATVSNGTFGNRARDSRG